MIALVSSRLLDLLTLGNKRVNAMALWPFVLFRNRVLRMDQRIQNHERIHLRQQTELLLLPFYLWYFIEYWTAMFRNGFKHHAAYMSISFEKEAYAHEKDPEYLKQRRFLASINYLKKP